MKRLLKANRERLSKTVKYSIEQVEDSTTISATMPDGVHWYPGFLVIPGDNKESMQLAEHVVKALEMYRETLNS